MTTTVADEPTLSTFAEDLRLAYRRVAGVLAENELDLVARARDSINATPAERNELLARLLLAYRRGPRQLWAPVILDLLAPALIESLQGFRPEPPVIDEEEIRQQLVLEVLRAIMRMPIHEAGQQTRIRLITRANRAVVRWLEREGIHQRRQTELVDPAGGANDDPL